VNQRERQRGNVTWQGWPRLTKIPLSPLQKEIIASGGRLQDIHMAAFFFIVQRSTAFLPFDTLYCAMPDRINPVPKNTDHLQILYGNNHWICTYYDHLLSALSIYDSINNKRLEEEHTIFLRRLFPAFDSMNVIYPTVQNQTNAVDCGVFAIAFACKGSNLKLNILTFKRYDPICCGCMKMTALNVFQWKHWVILPLYFSHCVLLLKLSLLIRIKSQ